VTSVTEVGKVVYELNAVLDCYSITDFFGTFFFFECTLDTVCYMVVFNETTTACCIVLYCILSYRILL